MNENPEVAIRHALQSQRWQKPGDSNVEYERQGGEVVIVKGYECPCCEELHDSQHHVFCGPCDEKIEDFAEQMQHARQDKKQWSRLPGIIQDAIKEAEY